MKCEICAQELGTLYLDKPVGTVVKDDKGKKHWVCNECQEKFQSKEEQLKQISQK